MGARERWSDDDGFSLLELVVVTIILGILATIAIAVFFSQREKAFKSVAKSALRNGVTYAEIVREDSSSYSDDTRTYESEAPPSYTFTNEASDDPQELSLKAFGGGETLVIAAQARGTCLYVRLHVDAASDVRGHHDGAECRADTLEEAPEGAQENGWP